MAGRLRPEDVAAVRQRVPIAEVIGQTVTLRTAGAGSLKGLCPFHEERSPSFHVTPARGLYYCFGCGEGGDVVDFLMKFEHLTFVEAVEKLAVRAGVTLRYEDGGTPERRGPNRTRLALANQAAADFYRTQLTQAAAEPGRRFLSERGFDDSAAAQFGVGWAPRSWDGLRDHLRERGFADAEMIAAGLVSSGQRGVYDRFRGRLVWPIRDAAGDVLGFGARKLLADDEGPKYLNTPETPLYHKSAVLYGIDLARREIARARQVVVVEGYTDVMAAHMSGVTTAVATCGTAFGSEHASILRRYLVDDEVLVGEVIFTFDGDEAGQRAALRAFDWDQKFVSQTFVAVSPDGMDPCELRLARGEAAVRDLVATRTPLFAFAIRSALAGHDLATAEGRVAALRRAAPIVARVRDSALRPEYVRLLAGWVGLPEGQVREAVAESGRTPAGSAASQARGARRGAPSDRQPGVDSGSQAGHGGPGRPGPSRGTAASGRSHSELFVQREALKGALQAPELLGQWYDSVTSACFQHPGYALVHEAVVAAGGPSDDVTGMAWIDEVLACCQDDSVRALVRELAVESLVTAGDVAARYVTSIVARLLADDAGRRLAELKRELGSLDAVSDADRATAILADLMELEGYRRQLARVGSEAL